MVDGLSWLFMIVSLAWIRTPLQEGKGWRGMSFDSLREGLKYVSSHKVIFPLMLMDFGAMFFGSAKALLPVYARDILAVGPRGLGLLYAAGAVGSLTAAVGFSLFGGVRRAGLWIFTGVTVYGLSTVLFAGSRIFWFSVLLLAVGGAGDTISSILRGTINQLSTPDELRGRMASINSIFTNTGPPLGQFESGVVAAWLGAELSALTGGLATLALLAAAAVAFPAIGVSASATFRPGKSGPPRRVDAARFHGPDFIKAPSPSPSPTGRGNKKQREERIFPLSHRERVGEGSHPREFTSDSSSNRASRSRGRAPTRRQPRRALCDRARSGGGRKRSPPARRRS